MVPVVGLRLFRTCVVDHQLVVGLGLARDAGFEPTSGSYGHLLSTLGCRLGECRRVPSSRLVIRAREFRPELWLVVVILDLSYRARIDEGPHSCSANVGATVRDLAARPP